MNVLWGLVIRKFCPDSDIQLMGLLIRIDFDLSGKRDPTTNT